MLSFILNSAVQPSVLRVQPKLDFTITCL